MSRVSIKDIAQRLNINPSTVSKALRNKNDVSTALKNKVILLADKMGYKPNAAAIFLKSGKSKTIGLIIPEISTFFFPSILKAVEEIVHNMGYNLLILHSNDSIEREIENSELCANAGVEGILVSLTKETKDIEHFQELMSANVPIIYFDKVLHNSYGHKVIIPSLKAAKMATQKLLLQIKNKTKIIYGLFDDKRLSITEDRVLGYKEALEENGIPITQQHSFFVGNANETEALLIKWWKENTMPTGLFVMSDEILAGTVAALKKCKIQIPKDLNIVAISDGYFSKFSTYEIPYVETSGYLLGKKAATLLFDIIENPLLPVEEHSIETKFINVKS
jgi:DNA-binding LacI/PurR family transcriptional regulator